VPVAVAVGLVEADFGMAFAVAAPAFAVAAPALVAGVAVDDNRTLEGASHRLANSY
jgi:hypothetical protein